MSALLLLLAKRFAPDLAERHCWFAGLIRGAQWSGDYSTDFSQVLPGGRFDQKTLSSGAGAAGADDGEGGLRYSAVSRSLQADSGSLYLSVGSMF